MKKQSIMKTYLLLVFVFISTFIAAQNVRTTFDQLVSVNEQWLNQKDVDQALKALYGAQEVSLQQLSATFRRGDLIGRLRAIEV